MTLQTHVRRRRFNLVLSRTLRSRYLAQSRSTYLLRTHKLTLFKIVLLDPVHQALDTKCQST